MTSTDLMTGGFPVSWNNRKTKLLLTFPFVGAEESRLDSYIIEGLSFKKWAEMYREGYYYF